MSQAWTTFALCFFIPFNHGGQGYARSHEGNEGHEGHEGQEKAAIKKSVIAKGKRGKNSFFKGSKAKTSSGFMKAALMKNKRDKVVSKKENANGKCLGNAASSLHIPSAITETCKIEKSQSRAKFPLNDPLNDRFHGRNLQIVK